MNSKKICKVCNNKDGVMCGNCGKGLFIRISDLKKLFVGMGYSEKEAENMSKRLEKKSR